MENITQLLIAWSDGDQQALDRLIPFVYKELHRMAARQMNKERPEHTLQTTALVNEAYCKLVDQKNVRWQNRAQFFFIAARLMRRILVDHAKSHLSAKRGGSFQRVTLESVALVSPEQAGEWVALDEALNRLAEFDEQKSRIVEMKFFGGLSTEEIAEVEKISTRTVEREWHKARAWLFQEMHR